MNELKNKIAGMIEDIKRFYNTNYMLKMVTTAVSITVVIGAVVVTVFFMPTASSTGENDKKPVVTAVERADKGKEDKPKEEKVKADDSKTDEAKVDEVTKDEVKPEEVATPENKPASTSGTDTSSKHEHNWVANMVTIPGSPERWKDTIIPEATYPKGFYTWPDGCKIEVGLWEANEAAIANHDATHGTMTVTSITETITVPASFTREITEQAVPERQEQHGYKCSCGATK